MQKTRKLNALTGSVLTLAVMAGLMNLDGLNVYAEETTSSASAISVYDIDMNDQTPLDTLKQEVLTKYADSEESLDLEDINTEASTLTVSSINWTQAGLQPVTLQLSVVTNDDNGTSSTVGYDLTETAEVNLVSSGKPQLVLKSSEVTIDLGSTFSYADNIGLVSDVNNALPALSETDNVDVNTEGTYNVTVEATNSRGTSSVSYTVTVKKPAEVVKAEQETQQTEETAAGETETAAETCTVAADGTDTSTQAIANAALAQVGVKQDCTMLVTNALKAVGIYFHGWPYEYLSLGTITSNPVPGDIIVYEGHVAIYIGNGMAVHGGWNGTDTVVYSVNVPNALIAYVHVNL
jgi:hypothetical protein